MISKRITWKECVKSGLATSDGPLLFCNYFKTSAILQDIFNKASSNLSKNNSTGWCYLWQFSATYLLIIAYYYELQTPLLWIFLILRKGHTTMIIISVWFRTQIWVLKFGLSEMHTNFKKSSSWFRRLLSKSADLSKPWGRFFQILSASQKVRTLT